MGRTSKKTENTTVEEKTVDVIQEEQTTENIQEEQAVKDSGVAEQAPADSSDNKKVKEEIPPHVVKLMQLYSHYEEIWVTSRGFVHPIGAPKYLLKDAVLYKNKFYNK